MDGRSAQGMKALLIIAPRNFRDEEYFDTKKALEEEGVAVTTASEAAGEASGMLGGKAVAEIGLGEADAGDYDAVVFIGGTGAQGYFDHPRAQELAMRASAAGKTVAAICIAPVILANAGLLKGRRATCFGGVYAGRLEAGGAEYTGESVVRDDNLITASGPEAAKEFGSEIARALAEGRRG